LALNSNQSINQLINFIIKYKRDRISIFLPPTTYSEKKRVFKFKARKSTPRNLVDIIKFYLTSE